MMTDPIADMLTHIRNSISAGHDRVEFPASKLKAGICKVLKDEGYIKSLPVFSKSNPPKKQSQGHPGIPTSDN